MTAVKTVPTVSLLYRDYPNTGRRSYYLNFYPGVRNPYTGKVHRREYLGLYAYTHPRTQTQREFNAEIEEKAEAIRCKRYMQLINEEFGFFDKHRFEGDFLAWFKEMAKHKNQKWIRVYDHFYNFVGGKCTFADITVELVKRFGEYLQNANQLRDKKRKLRQNSVAGYFSTFRGALKIAYRDNLIKDNVNDHVDKIEWEDVKKEYLTRDEVQLLYDSDCDIPVLRLASLFSCLTGLRISDILNLTWDNIVEDPNIGTCIRIRTQKTQTEATLPICDDALELCGERSTGKVFKGLQRSMTHKPLKAWLNEIGIRKHITFHCFRHTFATLQVAAGTDIYTVPKLLTHKNVTTTQIYADLVSSVKREAVNRLSLKKKKRN